MIKIYYFYTAASSFWLVKIVFKVRRIGPAFFQQGMFFMPDWFLHFYWFFKQRHFQNQFLLVDGKIIHALRAYLSRKIFTFKSVHPHSSWVPVSIFPFLLPWTLKVINLIHMITWCVLWEIRMNFVLRPVVIFTKCWPILGKSMD